MYENPDKLTALIILHKRKPAISNSMHHLHHNNNYNSLSSNKFGHNHCITLPFWLLALKLQLHRYAPINCNNQENEFYHTNFWLGSNTVSFCLSHCL